MTGSFVVLLHLCDSLFPIGSFSHSDGLEAATSGSDVQTADDLRAWMDATLLTSLRRVEGPAVLRAHDAFSANTLDDLASLDDELHAMRPSSTGRNASRAMGVRLVKTWQRLRPHERVEALLLRRNWFTLPVAFGIVSSASDIAGRASVEAFFYTRLAATLSAAMRLMPIGQHDGHTLLADLLTRVPGTVDQLLIDRQPFHSFAPALDIAAMSQQYGHSRLFRS